MEVGEGERRGDASEQERVGLSREMELAQVVTRKTVHMPGLNGGGTVEETEWTYKPKETDDTSGTA